MASRRRAWADQRIAIAALTDGSPSKLDLLANAPASDTRTVVRLIGDLTFMYSPNSTIVDSLSIVDVGIGVASAEAFAVGGNALPNPGGIADQDPARGWLYAATKPVFQQAESTGVINAIAHFTFDLRAMRKVDKGVLYMIMEQNDILVGGSMRVIGRVRSLCLN